MNTKIFKQFKGAYNNIMLLEIISAIVVILGIIAFVTLY